MVRPEKMPTGMAFHFRCNWSLQPTTLMAAGQWQLGTAAEPRVEEPGISKQL